MCIKKRLILLLFPACVFFLPLDTQALEVKLEDLSASVAVAPVFSLSLDNPNLAFGSVKSGETKVLGEGRYFNEVRCRSNSGQSWLLKAQLISLGLLERQYSISSSNLKWKVVESTGSGETIGRLEFKEFSEQPLLIYASQGDDNRGKEIVLRFQYSLTAPIEAPAGNYVGQIIFTMTENP